LKEKAAEKTAATPKRGGVRESGCLFLQTGMPALRSHGKIFFAGGSIPSLVEKKTKHVGLFGDALFEGSANAVAGAGSCCGTGSGHPMRWPLCNRAAILRDWAGLTRPSYSHGKDPSS